MYLQVLDDFVRKPNENTSIGIVLCKSADKTYVEYAVRDYEKPMGVATYKTASDPRPVIKVGINFSSSTRSITGWKIG